LQRERFVSYLEYVMSTLTEVREALPRLSESERYDLLQHLSGAVPSIVNTPGVCGGDACFLRTRVPVWAVIRARELGVSESDILRSYPALTAEDLVHAYHYAKANGSEIARAIAANEEE